MKFLFISHNAKRQGAPIILLNVIRKVKISFPDSRIILVLKESGELLDEFKTFGEVIFWVSNNPKVSLLRRIFNKVSGKVESYEKKLIERLIQLNFDIIYANTVATIDILLKIKRPGIKSVLHVHEMPSAIDFFFGKEAFIKSISEIDAFIAVSQKVKTGLINNFGVTSKKIALIHEFIDTKKYTQLRKAGVDKYPEIPANGFIVGMSGTTDIRKGFDLLPQLIKRVNDRKIFFIWVGGFKNDPLYTWVNHDLVKLGVQDQFIHYENQKFPEDIYIKFDVFVLLSREDPFPLVCLENAALRKPLLIFDNSTGIEELFAKKIGGKVASYLNINEMAEGILDYANNTAKSLEHGKNVQETVVNNFDATIQLPKYVQVIRRLLDMSN